MSDPYKAYSFRSSLSLDQMEALVLKSKDPSWRGGDNDHWGGYLVGRFEAHRGRLRIFVDGARFVVDLSRSRDDFDKAHRYLESTLLPLLEAEDVQRHEGWG